MSRPLSVTLLIVAATSVLSLHPDLSLAAEGDVLSTQKISATQGGFTGLLKDADSFGWSVTSIGDLNHDSVTDLAVGVPFDDDGGNARGAVWILLLDSDGTVRTQQKISDTEGGFTGILDDGDQFGISVASLSDLDGDTVGELAVGAYQDDDGGQSRGAVWILFLKADGTVKSHQKISDTEGNFTGVLDNSDFFGYSVSSLSQFDGDLVCDLAVGAPLDDDGGLNQGAVWLLLLNPDGTVKSHQKISATEGGFGGLLRDSDEFGWSISSRLDIDGDLVRDLVVGARFDDDGGTNRGAVWVLFLNSDGTVRSYEKISHLRAGFLGDLDDDDEFGSSVAAVGGSESASCEGLAQLVVGAPRDDDGGIDRGAAWVLFLNGNGSVASWQKISSTSGNFLGPLDQDDRFGVSVAPLGDLDRDGVADFAVGSWKDDDGGPDRGAVWTLFLDGCNTSGGTDVAIDPVDQTTGETPVTVTYEQVTSSGKTTLATSEVGPAPPTGLKKGSPAQYYEVSTTAQYAQKVTLKMSYDEARYARESAIKVYHREADPTGTMKWVDRTKSIDTASNQVVAEVNHLSLFALFEETSGSVTGVVTADCPEPETGLLGVRVDAFAKEEGTLAGTSTTNVDGTYVIEDLLARDYTITVVSPLGYTVGTEEFDAIVPDGGSVVVDVDMSCEIVPAAQRSIGFWKHQVGVAMGGPGHAQIDGATLCDFLDVIEAHFNSNAINEVVIYVPPASGSCGDKLDVAKELLNLRGNVGHLARARQQLLALLFNVAAQYVSLAQIASVDGATISQAITFCDHLIDDPGGDHDLAQSIAATINEGGMVAAGLIPLDTDDIAYAIDRDREPVLRISPNPGGTQAYTLSFRVPVAGRVELAIYNVAGRKIDTLFEGPVVEGQRETRWFARTSDGRPLSHGVYFVRLTTTEGRTTTTKFVHLAR